MSFLSWRGRGDCTAAFRGKEEEEEEEEEGKFLTDEPRDRGGKEKEEEEEVLDSLNLSGGGKSGALRDLTKKSHSYSKNIPCARVTITLRM